MHKCFSSRARVAVAVVVAVLVGGAIATAARSDLFLDSAGRYHGCVAAKTGDVRVIREGTGCRRREVAIVWSQAGPAGAPVRSAWFVNGYSEHVLVQPGSFRFANAICPADTLVVGGGYATKRIASARLAASNSYPVTMPDGRGAWYVVMQNLGAEPEEFWAISYCVRST